jgi:hypothetical protein
VKWIRIAIALLYDSVVVMDARGLGNKEQ